MSTRRQLTLFVAPPERDALERVRRDLDPVQQALIAAHVTLCREDELAPLSDDALRTRLASPALAPITLRFGEAERFDGHGVLLPCIEGAHAFEDLRAHVLGTGALRAHRAHLTLAHPRNPRAPGNTPERWGTLPSSLELTFGNVSWIEQRDGGPWRVLQTFPLGTSAR
jgi:hypothetical protein